ncbi:MAG: DUF952 domain-containing protein [Myxococcales bacterium]|nr:MAG: DUF952 domain-containing protein [Myxococcales bacterium]
MNPPRFVYRLLSIAAWQRAQSEGHFLGSEHDERDGFIHLSTAEQVAETAARHYARQPSLLLLWVKTAELGASLRFEPSRGGALFPHLYGPLPVSAVERAEPLSLDVEGNHRFPSALE